MGLLPLNLLGSPIASFALSLLTGLDQQNAFDRAVGRNEQRLQDVLGGSRDLQSQLLGINNRQGRIERNILNRISGDLTGDLRNRFGANEQRLAQGSRSILDELAQSNRLTSNQLQGLQRDINQRFADRTATGLDFLRGASQQGREDIGLRFGNLQRKNALDLASRGLSGSTVASNVRTGTEREQSRELRRFDEGVRRELLDTFTRLSGEELGARTNLGLARTDLSSRLADAFTGRRIGLLGAQTDLSSANDRDIVNFDLARQLDALNALRNRFTRNLDITSTLGQNRLNTLENVSEPAPGRPNVPLQFGQLLGGNSAPAPSQPSGFASFFSGGGGAGILSLASLLGGAGILPSLVVGAGGALSSLFGGKSDEADDQ